MSEAMRAGMPGRKGRGATSLAEGLMQPFPLDAQGFLHTCCRVSLESETVALPRCRSPLDSGFRRNDGG